MQGGDVDFSLFEDLGEIADLDDGRGGHAKGKLMGEYCASKGGLRAAKNAGERSRGETRSNGSFGHQETVCGIGLAEQPFCP
jgi:hypothetical protein